MATRMQVNLVIQADAQTIFEYAGFIEVFPTYQVLEQNPQLDFVAKFKPSGHNGMLAHYEVHDVNHPQATVYKIEVEAVKASASGDDSMQAVYRFLAGNIAQLYQDNPKYQGVTLVTVLLTS